MTVEIKTTKSPFLFLAIDLPPRPVFQGVIEKDIIPQVPIAEVLAKYDGVTTQEAKGIIRRYKITKLPPFLILHIKRFTKNNFVEEKNPTIVNYPLRGVDMQDCEFKSPRMSCHSRHLLTVSTPFLLASQTSRPTPRSSSTTTSSPTSRTTRTRAPRARRPRGGRTSTCARRATAGAGSRAA